MLMQAQSDCFGLFTMQIDEPKIRLSNGEGGIRTLDRAYAL